MKKKLRIVCLGIFLSFSINTVSSADLIFVMTATKNVLAVGEEATIGIWAYAEEAAGLNGLNVWQLDMVVDVDGVVEVKTTPSTEISLIAPAPYDTDASGWDSVNSPLSGNVLELGMSTLVYAQDSDTGVGDFSLLAEITIKGIGAGQVTYNLIDNGTMGFYGILRDGEYYDINNGNLEFRPGNNVFTVAPEPSCLILLATMAGFALRSRKAHVWK